MLAGLASIDLVTTFAEDTPDALIAALRPDMTVTRGGSRPGNTEVEKVPIHVSPTCRSPMGRDARAART